MCVVSCRGDPRKQAIEKGVHETQKRGKPLKSGLMSRFLLWAAGGQCCWGLFKRRCQIHHNTHQGAGKLGYFSINSNSSLLCPHGQMQVAIGVDQEISAGSDLQREVGNWLTLSAILSPSLNLTHYIFVLEESKYFVEFFENILMSPSPSVKIRSDEYFIFQH